jgi:hypothetical protein
MGGPQHDIIKTNVENYERVELGKGYFGVVVKNPVKEAFHLAEETSGALIGSDVRKMNLIKKVKKDVSTGDPEVMKIQIKQGKHEREIAISLESPEFFRRFKHFKDRRKNDRKSKGN